MYTFPDLIKKIRKEASLTQSDFAIALDVSPVLIAMVETGQKEVSKNFITKLANLMEVHPSSITPFLFFETNQSPQGLSGIEKSLVNFGEKMQQHLIHKKAPLLRKYARK